MGNSFARDFGNILLESNVKDDIDLSYCYSFEQLDIERVQQCDILFSFVYKDEVPDWVWSNVKSKSLVYGIGTKNFGECNGVFYRHRNEDIYFNQTTKIGIHWIEDNEIRKDGWGEGMYIDLITVIQNQDGTVPIFSDDHRFLSLDCRHLSQAGAQYYSRILDLNSLLGL